MANRTVPGTPGPEHEGRAGRRLAIPFVFMIALVLIVMAIVVLAIWL